MTETRVRSAQSSIGPLVATSSGGAPGNDAKSQKNYWRALVIRIIGKHFGKDIIVAAFVFGVEEERVNQELSTPRATCNVYLAIF
jgi:hypothetical protein